MMPPRRSQARRSAASFLTPYASLLAAIQRAPADVATVLHAVEVNGRHRFVGAFLRHAHAIAERGHRQHTAGAHHGLAILDSGTGVEHVQVVGSGAVGTKRRESAYEQTPAGNQPRGYGP